MYKCHLCGLETRQLNGLMSRHWKQHADNQKEYKTQLLNFNGRPQKNCKVCNLPTAIPKGESEYPDYHKGCELNNRKGANNSNYKGGRRVVSCHNCNKKRKSYSSQLEGTGVFCSISCSRKYHHKQKINSLSSAELQDLSVQRVIRRLLRTRLTAAIRGNFKSGSAVKDLGCTIPELKLYLESKFQPGMSWLNRGKNGWHIDHIRPLSSFDLANPEELKKACHYSNLQPLWATDNLKKHCKY